LSAFFKLSKINGPASENKSSNACLISAMVYEFSSFDNWRPKAASPEVSVSTFDLPKLGPRLSRALFIDVAENIVSSLNESLFFGKNVLSFLAYVALL
jgi:hypothetical protein